jgi:hypothetical protein
VLFTREVCKFIFGTHTVLRRDEGPIALIVKTEKIQNKYLHCYDRISKKFILYLFHKIEMLHCAAFLFEKTLVLDNNYAVIFSICIQRLAVVIFSQKQVILIFHDLPQCFYKNSIIVP